MIAYRIFKRQNNEKTSYSSELFVGNIKVLRRHSSCRGNLVFEIHPKNFQEARNAGELVEKAVCDLNRGKIQPADLEEIFVKSV